jgi:hypothetical protein
MWMNYRPAFSITLEDQAQLDDEAYTVEGWTWAVPMASAVRMQGITMD